MPDARAPAAGDREAAERLPTDWSRPTFTAHLRGAPTLPLPAREDRLVHVSSLAFRATRAIARVPGLGRLFGAPDPDEEEVLGSPLYRRLTGVRRTAAYRRLWLGGLRTLVPRGSPMSATPGTPP